MWLDGINGKVGFAYYHFNCRHIHNNEGDIKLDEVQRSQNTIGAFGIENLFNLMPIDGI